MLRLLLILLLTSTASAQPFNRDGMTPIADEAAACTASRARVQMSPTARCSVTSKVGNAQLLHLEDSGNHLYAIVLKISGTLLVSEPIEVDSSSCGMMKCDVTDKQVPSLRVLTSGVVVLSVAIAGHHEHTADDGNNARQVIDDRWTATSMISCRDSTCTRRDIGGRHNSCTVKVANDGTLTSTCIATDWL